MSFNSQVRKVPVEAVGISHEIPTLRKLKIAELTSLGETFKLKTNDISGELLIGEAELVNSRNFLSRDYAEKTHGRTIADLGGLLVLDLPPLHEEGKLTIFPIEAEQASKSNYLATIKFADQQKPFLSYQTKLGASEKIEKVLENSAILMSLPKETLEQVIEQGKLLVVSGSFKGNEIGEGLTENNIFLELTWDGPTNTINVVKVNNQSTQTDNKSVFFLISESNLPFVPKVDMGEGGIPDVLNLAFLDELMSDLH